MSAPDLPLYQAFRQVRACRIGAIERVPSGWLVRPAEPFLDSFNVPQAFVSGQNPLPGGYLVIRHTGFMKYVPAVEFEADHFQVDALKDRRQQLLAQLAEVDTAITQAERTTP